MPSQHVRELTAMLRWDVDDKELRRNEQQVARFKRGAGGLERTAAKAGKALAGMFAAGAVARGARDATREALAFDRTLADLQALLPGQTQRVRDLGAAIRQLAVQTGKDAGDLSRATYQIVSSFGDTADTVDSLALATQVATAGNTNAAASIDLLSGVTLAFGDTSLAAQRKVADLAFTTVRLGKTTIPELSASVGTAATQFATLGASQEELFASFTALAGVTGNTQNAGTQLNALGTTLLARTKAMDKAFKALGVTSAQALVAERGGLIPAMRALVGTTDGSAEAIQKLVGNVRAARAVMNLTGAGVERFDKALAASSRSAGATQASVRAVTDGAGAMAVQFAKAEQRAKELERAVGDRIKGPMLQAKQATLDVADAISRDLVDAIDVFQGRADKLEGSAGFGAIRKLSQLFGLLRAGGVLVEGGVEAVGTAAGAAGAVIASGGKGAGDIRRQLDRDLLAQGEQTRARLGFIGQQIFDPEAARERARLARVGAAARAETQEAGGTRRERERRAIATGDVKAFLSIGTVRVDGGSGSADDVIGGLKTLGEGLADRLSRLAGSSTPGGQ